MQRARTHLQTVFSRCQGGFIAAFILSFAINLLVLTGSIYMLQVYDRVLSSHNTSTLLYLTLMAIGALLVMALLDVLRARILVRVSGWIDRVLSPLVFARMIDTPARSGASGVEALRDVATLRNFLGGGASVTLMDAPWTPLYLAFVYLLHPWLGTVALVGAIILFSIALCAHVFTQGVLRSAGEEAAAGFRFAASAARNSEVISGMGMTSALARRWDGVNASVLELQARASDRAGWLSASAKFTRMSLQIAMLGVGASLVLDNAVGAGAMVAGSIIMGRALAPVEQAIGVWKQVVGARESWTRLRRLFQETAGFGAGMSLPRPAGALLVESVSCRPYGAREPVLQNVSFALAPGEAMAIIGPSGAGKSTLARMLLGLHAPLAGAVRLDGADVFRSGRRQFGEHVGFLPQDVELFPGSVRDNIARMDPDADPQAIIAAARLAGVHELILRLPDGYETMLGEKGAPLSGGQLQRVGLARALFGSPCLVVLDEPNANLDGEGEQALNAAIGAMKQAGASVVIVAHRPSMMMHMEKVLVLKDGKVQMFGDRDTVLERVQRPSAGEKRRVRVVS